MAAVGERLKLSDPVILAAWRAEEELRAAQQIAILLRVELADQLGAAAGIGGAARVEPGHDESLIAAPRLLPGSEHSPKALLLWVRCVGNRRDIALGGWPRRAARCDRDWHNDGIGAGGRRGS